MTSDGAIHDVIVRVNIRSSFEKCNSAALRMSRNEYSTRS